MTENEKIKDLETKCEQLTGVVERMSKFLGILDAKVRSMGDSYHRHLQDELKEVSKRNAIKKKRIREAIKTNPEIVDLAKQANAEFKRWRYEFGEFMEKDISEKKDGAKE